MDNEKMKDERNNGREIYQFDFTPDLVHDDDEFIHVAEVVLQRLKWLKRDNYPSWFQRTFKKRRRNKSSTKKARQPCGILTSETLHNFKFALLIRLDDTCSSVFIESCSACPIPVLISSVVRYVDKVGWPATDGGRSQVIDASDISSDLSTDEISTSEDDLE